MKPYSKINTKFRLQIYVHIIIIKHKLLRCALYTNAVAKHPIFISANIRAVYKLHTKWPRFLAKKNYVNTVCKKKK